MEFKLKINPTVDGRKFLESRIEALLETEAGPGLPRLKEDVANIFAARYDKLRRDSRFCQVFTSKQKNIRQQETTLGETIIGAFALMDTDFKQQYDSLSDPAAREGLEKDYYGKKIRALENIFAGEIAEFERFFVSVFLKVTCREKEPGKGALEQALERMKAFLDDKDTLLRFFFLLDEFNRLVTECRQIEEGKSSSFSKALEEEIQKGGAVDKLQRQVVDYHKLEYLSGSLAETAKDRNPLDSVIGVLNEVCLGDDRENVIQGPLEKFRKYHEFELACFREALAYKQVIFLNSGSKEGKTSRQKWIESFDYETVNRLVNLLNVTLDPGQQLTREQDAQKALYAQLRYKLDEYAGAVDPAQRVNCLEPGEMNLLIIRLSNTAQFEEQIEAVGKKLDASRKDNRLESQSAILKSYSENIRSLVESVFYFIELSLVRRPELKDSAVELHAGIASLIKKHEEDLKKKGVIPGGGSEEKGSVGKKDADDQAVEESATAVKGEKLGQERVAEGVGVGDGDRKAEIMASQLKELPDASKIKPLKELAYIGGLNTLRHLLPLSQYSSDFLRKLVRNTVIKIILRTLKEDEQKAVLGIQQKKKLIDLVIGLDKKYAYLKEMNLGDPRTTSLFLDILIRENSEFTARTMAELIGDADDQVRANAVKLLTDMLDQKEFNLLLKLLNDPNERVRANVIESLELVGNRNVVGILMKYKKDKNNRIRGNTLKALWNLGYRDIDEPLRDMLLNLDANMRASGVWVIGEIGHKQPDLQQLLALVRNDKNEMVKDNVKRATEKISKREKGLKVLMVDDDSRFSQDVSRHLTADGFRVSVASNGKTGLWKAVNQGPDILLLDARLPVMNGLEVLKQFRAWQKEQGDSREIPVLVFFDFNSSVLIHQAKKSGANDFLIKPCSYEKVKEKIQLFL